MFNITSGNIKALVLYVVFGAQSVTYNGTTYTTGQTFRGIQGITTYTFSGSGTQLVYEVLELNGGAIDFVENGQDYPTFPDTTLLTGFAIEYMQNANDIFFNDITKLSGFAVELLDYPFYGFQVTKRIL